MMLQYLLVRVLLFPFAFLPHKAIHAIGRMLGRIAYHVLPKFRKRALSNLSLTDLDLSQKQLKKIALLSMQNLVINCLEFAKFAKSNIAKSIICENPECAQSLSDAGQGIVFFCGHQSNWETLFLDGTRRMKGVAIGRPVKNQRLYAWVKSVRERFNGTIVEPKQAIGKGLRALREGKFMGIVGDQGMPGGYESRFLGRRAFTSPAPAILAYKTRCPIMVATTRRKNGKYFIHYSDPIWPNPEKSLEEEVPRLMDKTLEIYADSIRKNPGEWLWQHNRWKQETPDTVYYRFRHDTILVILGKKQAFIAKSLRKIYPHAFLTFLVPQGETVPLEDVDVIEYATPEDCLLLDYRFKLVLNLANLPEIASHYGHLAAIEVATLNDLTTTAKEHLLPGHNLEDVIERALCRPGTIWENHATQ